MVNLINIFVKNKNLSYSNLGKARSYSYDGLGNRMGIKEFTYLQDELGSTIRLLEQGEESQTIYGYDEFGEDTYCTQGRLQPFGYTGYRYDKVADTYFAQAREYMPGVGRFAGEDWIKGSIEQPFSLNQYGYCLGNQFGLVDYDGKKPRVPLANPSNAAPPKSRKYAENDALQNKSGAPYVGVFYLNIESGPMALDMQQ